MKTPKELFEKILNESPMKLKDILKRIINRSDVLDKKQMKAVKDFAKTGKLTPDVKDAFNDVISNDEDINDDEDRMETEDPLLISAEHKILKNLKESADKTSFECMECGAKFKKKISKSGEVRCPKCKSGDLEVESVLIINLKDLNEAGGLDSN